MIIPMQPGKEPERNSSWFAFVGWSMLSEKGLQSENMKTILRNAVLAGDRVVRYDQALRVANLSPSDSFALRKSFHSFTGGRGKEGRKARGCFRLRRFGFANASLFIITILACFQFGFSCSWIYNHPTKRISRKNTHQEENDCKKNLFKQTDVSGDFLTWYVWHFR